MEAIRKAQVSESGESLFAVDIEVSGHRLKGDEPEEHRGANLGPAPYDLLLASLGECTAMTVRWYAEEKKIPLEKVEVALTHCKRTDETGRRDHITKEITLHGPDLTEEQKAKLMEVAAKCPVQRTIQGELVIETK